MNNNNSKNNDMNYNNSENNNNNNNNNSKNNDMNYTYNKNDMNNKMNNSENNINNKNKMNNSEININNKNINDKILEKDKVNKFFKNIKQISSNNKCADCQKSSPIWVTITYSLFICSDCASKHRQMGVKKSKVKSTLLDKWTIGEILRIFVGGNKRGHLLGDERDFNIKYNEAEWYIEEIDKLVENYEGLSFLNIPDSKNNNKCIEDIKESPLPKFGDESFIVEENIKEENKNLKEKKKNKPKEIFVIKKKSTPILSKNKKYEIDDEFRGSRLGFGSDVNNR